MRRLVSVWVWTTTGIIVVLWLPWMALLWLLTRPFDDGRYLVGRWFRWAAVSSVKLNPLWDFRTSGFRPEDPRRPYVAVSNHESIADIFLISHLPWEMKWLSKAEVFRIPIMGWLMALAWDVRVRRHDPESRLRSLSDMRERLDRKVSIMIFPEGTRSGTGDLLPFRNGAFRLAIERQVPILPMAVVGTRTALTKGSLLLGRSRAEVRVLEPVETAGLTADDVPELRERVRRRIIDARESLRRELAAKAAKEEGALA